MEQCWRCRERRLVCDGARPACLKCNAANTDCPGYGGRRPVRFRAPLQKPDFERRGSSGSRRRRNTSGADIVQSRGPGEQALLSLDWHLQTGDLALVEAAIYHNKVREDWFKSSFLEGNLFHFEVTNLSNINAASQQVMVVRVLSHRILAPGSRYSGAEIDALQAKTYHHLDKAIKAVLAEILWAQSMHGNQQLRLKTACGVLQLGVAELFFSRKPNWRPHFLAFQTLLDDLGGVKRVFEAHPWTRRTLIIYIITLVTSNATSPASDQIAPTADWDLSSWAPDDCSMWEYPAFLCPRTLFLLIMRVNYLRLQCVKGHDIHEDIEAVLQSIDSFSPELWTLTTKRGHHRVWVPITQLYQLAVRIYALSTRCHAKAPGQGSNLDDTGHMAQSRAELLRLVQELPQEILARYCLVWPITIAGVHATLRVEQETVRSLLTEISQSCGMMSPLLAIKVLETFWQSKDRSWDACFDKPYAFLA